MYKVLKLAGLVVAWQLVGVAITIASDAEEAEERETPFTVRLVDEEGKPVVGAACGLMAFAGLTDRPPLTIVDDSWCFLNGANSNDEGTARLISQGDRDPVCVVARHSTRRIVAVKKIEAKDLNSTAW